MQRGRRRRAARQDEGGERRELAVEPVDLALQPLDLALAMIRSGSKPFTPRSGVDEVGAEVEQVVLDPRQHGVELRVAGGVQAGEADAGVGLVDVAIGLDPQAVLADALAGGQAACRRRRRSGYRCG